MVEPSEPGVRACMKCGWLFVSPDPIRVGRCSDCKHNEDGYEPKSARIGQVDQAVQSHFSDAL